MKTVKKIAALVFVFVLILSAAQADGWHAAEANQARFLELFDLLEASIAEGGSMDEGAADAVLEAIRRDSADDYDIAKAITDHWNSTVLNPFYAMFAHRGQETAYPLERSGLDFSGKHAFIVLGFKLEDGEMQEELIGRCDAAAAAARSFPESILITTGGATGANNPEGHTEAGLMKDYLIEQHGIDAGRIFAETEAMTTLENAVNSFRIMKRNGIETFTIVTSNYHQRWSQILFNAMAAIYEKESGYKVRIVGNFNYIARPDAKRTAGCSIGLAQLRDLIGK